ncbi:MAG TPA: hypothetical protein VFM43_08695 [Gaiellaceae bacterium]|nr:hypothetical protein [Gaiellaceae bacterium]
MTDTVDWDSLERTLAAACDGAPDDETAEQAVRAAELVAATSGEPADELSPADRAWAEGHGIPSEELLDLACRSMKCVASLSDDWHDRLNDLRFRLGDVAAA